MAAGAAMLIGFAIEWTIREVAARRAGTQVLKE